MTNRTSKTAIDKLRRLQFPPNGTPVLARRHFQGVIDGMTVNGEVIVLFDQPVEFLDMKVYRGTFPLSEIQVIE